MPVDSKLFRETMGRFPSGVVIATTVDQDGKRWGFTASAFSSLSLNPPLVLVCLDLKADSYPTFMAAKRFAINILRPQHEKIAMRFASKGGDKFSGGEFKAGKKLGMPVLPNALVSLECSMNQKCQTGDHVILIGLIEHAEVQDGAAMAYLGGKFYQVPPRSAVQVEKKKVGKAPAKVEKKKPVKVAAKVEKKKVRKAPAKSTKAKR